jgi:hypothetical protein
MLRFSPDSSYLVAQDSLELTIWGRPPQPEPVKPPPIATAPVKPTPAPSGKAPPEAVAGVPDRFQSLIRDLSIAGVPDSRRVEAVFVAALGRFPSEIEARTLAAQIATQADKAAALRGLLATLVDTTEFQAHAAAIEQLAKPKTPADVTPRRAPPKSPPKSDRDGQGVNGGRPSPGERGGNE